MNTFNKTLSSIPTKYLIGGAIALGIGAGIVIYKLSSQNQSASITSTNNNQSSTNPQIPSANCQTANPQKTLVRLINSLKKIEDEKTSNSYEFMKAIYQAQHELSRTDAKLLITRNRVERRKIINRLKDYAIIVSDQEDRIQNIHTESRRAILAHFKMSEQDWMNLLDVTSKQNKDDWDQFLIETETRQLDSLRQPNKPKLKLPVLIEIYKYRALVLRQSVSEYQKIRSECDPGTFYTVLQKLLEDLTAQKFRVEAEDINYSIKTLSPSQIQNLDQYQYEVKQLIQSLVLGNGLAIDQREDENYD